MSWLKNRYSNDVQPRDRHGPMDIDEPEPLSRLNQYSAPDDGYGEGPSRKRLHSDISTPSRPFTSQNRTIHVTPSTPFLFNISGLQVPPLPEAKPFQYDPSVFRGENGQRMDWGFGHRADRFGEDVEMSDSPAKPGWGNSLAADPPVYGASGPSTLVREESMEEVKMEDHPPPPAPSEPAPKDTKASKEETTEGDGATSVLGSGTSDKTTDKPERVYATGGIKREMRNRSKRKQQRQEANSSRHLNGSGQYDRQPALKHSEIPALILGYVQVFVNVAIVIFALYLGIHLVLTIRRDVKDRMQEASLEMRQEIAECSKLFLMNRCDPEFRVPAMEEHCRNWEICMNRDPTMVGRINVMAETFAGVINSFVEAMSWKTMGFTLATLSFLIILTNSALWNLRQKASPDPLNPPPVYMLPHPSMMRQFGQIGALTGQNGQAMDPSAHHDWSATGYDGVKQIEYGDKGKRKWKIW